VRVGIRPFCHGHGLGAGKNCWHRHEWSVIWYALIVFYLNFTNDVALLAELLELLIAVLETMASEAASLGLEVNW